MALNNYASLQGMGSFTPQQPPSGIANLMQGVGALAPQGGALQGGSFGGVAPASQPSTGLAGLGNSIGGLAGSAIGAGAAPPPVSGAQTGSSSGLAAAPQGQPQPNPQLIQALMQRLMGGGNAQY